MGWLFDKFGQAIAGHLQKPVHGYEPFAPSDSEALRDSLRPADVLLVEGDSRISDIIRYLTQSIWSHAALYVGPIEGAWTEDGESHVLIEANIDEGVISAPLSKYFPYHTRICRPHGLDGHDARTVCAYAIERIGLDYDYRNLTDLMRHLMPRPRRGRRHVTALGSRDPSRIICSALIAQAYQSVHYPILPRVLRAENGAARRDVLEKRHASLYTPRDFDISPYFAVVKPALANGFNYKNLSWADETHPAAADDRRAALAARYSNAIPAQEQPA